MQNTSYKHVWSYLRFMNKHHNTKPIEDCLITHIFTLCKCHCVFAYIHVENIHSHNNSNNHNKCPHRSNRNNKYRPLLRSCRYSLFLQGGKSHIFFLNRWRGFILLFYNTLEFSTSNYTQIV